MLTYPENRGSSYSINDDVAGELGENAIINPSDSGEVMIIHQIVADAEMEICRTVATDVTGGSAATIHPLESRDTNQQPASGMTAKTGVSTSAKVGYLRSASKQTWQFKGELQIWPGEALVLFNTDDQANDTRCNVIWREVAI